MNEVTILIPTFERPNCLEVLLKSLRQFYPQIKVFVADQGKDRLADEVTRQYDGTYYKIEYDVGVSATRNFLIEQVQTPYFFITDDDTIFTNKTNLEVLHQEITECNLDVLGLTWYVDGRQNTFHGSLRIDNNNILRRSHARPLQRWKNVIRWHVINMSFLAITDRFKPYKFDDRLKLSAETEFFWRVRNVLRIGKTTSVSMVHKPWRDELYQKLGYDRRDYYNQLAMWIIGVKGKGGRMLYEPRRDELPTLPA